MGAQLRCKPCRQDTMYFSRKISKVGGRLSQWRDEKHHGRDEKSMARDEISEERDKKLREESTKELKDDFNPYWQKKRKRMQDNVKLRVIEAGSAAIFPRRQKSVFLMS